MRTPTHQVMRTSPPNRIRDTCEDSNRIRNTYEIGFVTHMRLIKNRDTYEADQVMSTSSPMASSILTTASGSSGYKCENSGTSGCEKHLRTSAHQVTSEPSEDSG